MDSTPYGSCHPSLQRQSKCHNCHLCCHCSIVAYIFCHFLWLEFSCSPESLNSSIVQISEVFYISFYLLPYRLNISFELRVFHLSYQSLTVWMYRADRPWQQAWRHVHVHAAVKHATGRLVTSTGFNSGRDEGHGDLHKHQLCVDVPQRCTHRRVGRGIAVPVFTRNT